MPNVYGNVYDYGGADVYGNAYQWTQTVTVRSAVKISDNVVRVWFSGAIDPDTVGTADFAIAGNTVTGVDASTFYVDVTFGDPVAVGDTITVSVADGIDEADGDPISETELTVLAAPSPLLIPGLHYNTIGRRR